MTVGGNNDYGNKFDKAQSITFSRTSTRIKEKFNLETFSKDKMKEVTSLYQKYKNMIT